MPRTCAREGCGKALPPTSATQRKYCSGRCQVADWRHKQPQAAESTVKWTGRNGWYESDRGHIVNSIGRRWFITDPGERTPDVEKPSLREAKAYVEMVVAGEDEAKPPAAS